jgi:putative ABC transport system substrate-binding protein
VPAIFELREFAAAGGLISLARASPTAIGRSASTPATYSRERSRPTCQSCSINLKTAKALGLIIPETLLASADEVIQ